MDFDKPPDWRTAVLIGIGAFILANVCCLCTGATVIPLAPLSKARIIRR